MPEKKAEQKPPSFEEGLQQLESIVKEMEGGELPLRLGGTGRQREGSESGDDDAVHGNS
ncbi:MAG: hypothetical protein EBY15_10320 [Gammaproteobacteria bacterium]|nr:hypothetical protein [Gammaproteobacteria bacterium]